MASWFKLLSDKLFLCQFSGSNPLLGDLFSLIGSLLYAMSNVAQEFLVKNHSITEYLGLLGVSGSVIAAVQLYVGGWFNWLLVNKAFFPLSL